MIVAGACICHFVIVVLLYHLRAGEMRLLFMDGTSPNTHFYLSGGSRSWKNVHSLQPLDGSIVSTQQHVFE